MNFRINFLDFIKGFWEGGLFVINFFLLSSEFFFFIFLLLVAWCCPKIGSYVDC